MWKVYEIKIRDVKIAAIKNGHGIIKITSKKTNNCILYHYIYFYFSIKKYSRFFFIISKIPVIDCSNTNPSKLYLKFTFILLYLIFSFSFTHRSRSIGRNLILYVTYFVKKIYFTIHKSNISDSRSMYSWTEFKSVMVLWRWNS